MQMYAKCLGKKSFDGSTPNKKIHHVSLFALQLKQWKKL